MNYGYECKGWTAEDKAELAERLAKILESAKYVDDRIKAEVEIDRMYSGVRMRKLTWLTDASLDDVITESDKVFDEIAARRLQ